MKLHYSGNEILVNVRLTELLPIESTCLSVNCYLTRMREVTGSGEN